MGEWKSERVGEWKSGREPRLGDWENERVGVWESGRVGELGKWESAGVGDWETGRVEDEVPIQQKFGTDDRATWTGSARFRRFRLPSGYSVICRFPGRHQHTMPYGPISTAHLDQGLIEAGQETSDSVEDGSIHSSTHRNRNIPACCSTWIMPLVRAWVVETTLRWSGMAVAMVRSSATRVSRKSGLDRSEYFSRKPNASQQTGESSPRILR